MSRVVGFDSQRLSMVSPAGSTTMNLTNANEHVPEIDHCIRVVRERARCARHSLPFNRITILLLVHILCFSKNILSYFPIKGGVSTVYIPKTIISVNTLYFKRHLSLKIVQYFQVHKEYKPRNIQADRTKSAIYFVPSGNTKGGLKFISIHSAKKITRNI